MAGFLGQTAILTGETSGAQADSPAIAGLRAGAVVTASNNGPRSAVTVIMTDPATGTHNQVFTFDPLVLDGTNHAMGKATVSALADGGFVVAVESYVTFAQTDLLLQRFDASGATVGRVKTMNVGTERPAGTVSLDDTGKGYFMGVNTYGSDGLGHSLGRFYAKNGTLLAEVDIGDVNQTPPTGTVLANGKFALTWQTTAGTHYQLFNANGVAQGTDTLLANTGATPTTNYASKITALAGHGAAVAHVFRGDLHLQMLKNDGSTKGVELIVGTNSGTYSAAGDFDIATTVKGNIAVSWVEDDGINADIYFSLYSASGNLIVGPTIANTVTSGNQIHVQFSDVGKYGLMLGYYDDQFKSFSYTNAAVGVEIVSPDFFWEGGRAAETQAGTSGIDVLVGLGGNDTLTGLAGADYLRGGGGGDDLSGGGGADELVGDGGNDTLRGGAGNDILNGGTGDDRLFGDAGSDTLQGGNGKDRLSGGGGNDTMAGDAHNDNLKGGGGDDTMSGGTGKDRLSGGGGNDTMDGNEGNDKMAGDAGNDIMRGGTGNDRMSGGADTDALYGGDGNDTLNGDAGNDTLQGGTGDDTLNGGLGNDTLFGETGNDTLSGNAGADTFRFINTAPGQDVITDFEYGIDTLDMSITASLLQSQGGGSITVSQTAAGVLFSIDATNSVLVQGTLIADFQPGDYDISPV